MAAIALGQSLRILADSADDGAALVAADVEVGDYRDLDVLRAFALGCDVLTWDHEHVPGTSTSAHLPRAASRYSPGADGAAFRAGTRAMLPAARRDRHRVAAVDEPCRLPDPAAALREFGEDVGWPLVFRSDVGAGYDGKGVWVVDSLEHAAAMLSSGTPLLALKRRCASSANSPPTWRVRYTGRLPRGRVRRDGAT